MQRPYPTLDPIPTSDSFAGAPYFESGPPVHSLAANPGQSGFSSSNHAFLQSAAPAYVPISHDPEMVDLSSRMSGGTGGGGGGYWAPESVGGTGRGSAFEDDGEQDDADWGAYPTPWYRTKTAIWLFIVLGVVLAAVGLGVGLSLGLAASRRNQENVVVPSTSSTSTPPGETTITSARTSTSIASAVSTPSTSAASSNTPSSSSSLPPSSTSSAPTSPVPSSSTLVPSTSSPLPASSASSTIPSSTSLLPSSTSSVAATVTTPKATSSAASATVTSPLFSTDTNGGVFVFTTTPIVNPAGVTIGTETGYLTKTA